MLANGNYPYYLQQRISGDEGHLSNAQALELFQQYRSPALRLLILSHLSKNNNNPELVNSLFTQHAGDTKIVVASRYAASAVFEVCGDAGRRLSVLHSSAKTHLKKVKNERQLSLF